MIVLSRKEKVWEPSGFDFAVELLFEKRDVWVGFYWKKKGLFRRLFSFDLYVILIPCFPIHFSFGRA